VEGDLYAYMLTHVLTHFWNRICWNDFCIFRDLWL